MPPAVPTVSIGLPVYNGARYLQEALDSILAQTYADFELVVGDNGSTDGTQEICVAAAASDERVRFLPSDENRGAAWNYNRVFHATSGRYFRWAAHDDLLAPTYLERLAETLDASPPDVVLAQTETTVIDEQGERLRDHDDAFDASQADPARRIASLVRHLVMSNVFFGLMRREALARTRLHGAYPSADYVLIAELALLGRFTIVPERLFYRRVHPGMSRSAHLGLSSVAEWFEPGTGGSARPEFWRLFGEHLTAIRLAPLGRVQRLRVTGAFLPSWLARHKGAMAGELAQMARGGRRRSRSG
jgi:glycosyltransferase involved in cell wall biosynthesis